MTSSYELMTCLQLRPEVEESHKAEEIPVGGCGPVLGSG